MKSSTLVALTSLLLTACAGSADMSVEIVGLAPLPDAGGKRWEFDLDVPRPRRLESDSTDAGVATTSAPDAAPDSAAPPAPDAARPPAGGGGCGAPPPCFAMKSTGPTSRVGVPSTGFGVGTGDYTLEAWIKPHNEFPGCNDGVVLFQMNEDYGVAAFVCRYDISSRVVHCSAYDGGPGNPYVTTRPLTVGSWHHVAYVRSAGRHSIFLDGVLSASAVNATALVPTSGTSFGRPSGYPTQCAAPVTFGASRFSSTGRYAGAFTPTRSWSLDSATVAQWLTTRPLDGSTLVDEAGGDNTSTAVVGWTPVACD